ncbi:MAG: hypothetical protein KAY50_11385 [Chitinophagaceae bacterium]|nr:hypothetical protein [Chitinophagaceae bacterium]
MAKSRNKPFFPYIFICSFSILTIFICFIGCKAFKHGYTWSKAENSYNLVTGDKTNFGDKRLDYNKGFHRNSALSNFLDCKCNDRGQPGFIYEYKTDKKCRGIKLFYPKLDSVFIFEEPKKGGLNSILKEARKMVNDEREIFEQVKTGKL